jgi:hypothetical protein
MRNSNLTRHAEKRLGERCKLSPEKLKRLLDNGVAIPVALQKGGRHAKHLLYSCPDQDWFIVIQDANDGGVLTVTVKGPFHAVILSEKCRKCQE